MTRRRFMVLAWAALGAPAFASTSGDPPAGRELKFQIEGDFGGASRSDIEALLRSAGESIWLYCPHTRWEEPGFYIYHSDKSPITLDDHREDGRVAIGLTSQGNHWAQFAYQFAHEFCHALAEHSNEWHNVLLRNHPANFWLEESICETASLFALRAMGKSWQSKPPYPNWKQYAPHLGEYAADRIAKSKKSLPAGQSFADWFAANEPEMRNNAVLRDKNNVVALQLLPIFEDEPSGWETITFLNRGNQRNGNISLARHLAAWRQNVPSQQQEFIRRIAAVFSL